MSISFTKMPRSVHGEAFAALASKAADNLAGDCPRQEDEAIAWAWNKIQTLSAAIEKTIKSDDGASDLIDLMEAINMPVPSTTHMGVVHGDEVKYCSLTGKMWKRKHGIWVLSKARDSYGFAKYCNQKNHDA